MNEIEIVPIDGKPHPISEAAYVYPSFGNRGLSDRRLVSLQKARRNDSVDLAMFTRAIGSDSTPRVSVILPVRNAEAYLAETIESVLGQTYSEFELLVVDDASTDATPDISARYYRQDARMRYWRLPLGTRKNGAFAVGLALARADLIAEVNADDRWHPNLLEVLLSAHQDSPSAVVVFGNHTTMNEHGCVDAARTQRRDVATGRAHLSRGSVPDLLDKQIATGIMTTSVAALWQRRAVGRFPSFTDTHTDYWVSMQLASSGAGYYVDTYLADYRVHSSNSSAPSRYYSRRKAFARLRMDASLAWRLRRRPAAKHFIKRATRSGVLVIVGPTLGARLASSPLHYD